MNDDTTWGRESCRHWYLKSSAVDACSDSDVGAELLDLVVLSSPLSLAVEE